MKLTLLKLSTILMLTFGTAMGADDAGIPEATGGNMWGKHVAFIVNTGEKISAGVLCVCKVKKTMTLSQLLNVRGIEQTAGTQITVFKSTADNGTDVLTPEELVALGFTTDQNLGALPLSRFDAFGLVRGVKQPPYFLSIIGTVSAREGRSFSELVSLLEQLATLSIDQALVVQGAQAARDYVTRMYVLDRLAASGNGQNYTFMTWDGYMAIRAAANASQPPEPATTKGPEPATDLD